MCRLLCVRSTREFALDEHLDALARIARDSKEYQGHGWGCAWREGGGWRTYHSIAPIWEDRARPAGRSRLLLAHARSAFRDEGICVRNNMPFFDGRRVFMFNGELRGVRIRERGRIGAEKIFNVVKRFEEDDLGEALRRATALIEKRTRYVRAMNIVIADARAIYVYSRFSEDPDYFQMHRAGPPGTLIICSAPYPHRAGHEWQRIANGTVACFREPAPWNPSGRGR